MRLFISVNVTFCKEVVSFTSGQWLLAYVCYVCRFADIFLEYRYLYIYSYTLHANVWYILPELTYSGQILTKILKALQNHAKTLQLRSLYYIIRSKCFAYCSVYSKTKYHRRVPTPSNTKLKLIEIYLFLPWIINDRINLHYFVNRLTKFLSLIIKNNLLWHILLHSIFGYRKNYQFCIYY